MGAGAGCIGPNAHEVEIVTRSIPVRAPHAGTTLIGPRARPSAGGHVPSAVHSFEDLRARLTDQVRAFVVIPGHCRVVTEHSNILNQSVYPSGISRLPVCRVKLVYFDVSGYVGNRDCRLQIGMAISV